MRCRVAGVPALQPGNASAHCTAEGQPQDAHREEAHREDVAPHRLRATDASESQAIDVEGEDFHEAEEAGQIHRPRHLAGTHRLQFLVPICRTRLTNQKGYRTQCCSTVAVSAQFLTYSAQTQSVCFPHRDNTSHNKQKHGILPKH